MNTPMAPTLTSNSLLSVATPHYLRNSVFTVVAKKAGPFSVRLGKQSNGDPSSEENQAENSAFSNLFRFNFGKKMPDMTALIPVVNQPSGLSFGSPRAKDPGTVFVTGATGQAGIRIAQTLLREGFSVRAGVPDLGAAQELAQVAVEYKIISKEEAKRLFVVESTFDDAESIAKAIGNATKVVVTIGPAENGPTTEVTASDALQVIQASQLAGVGHVAIIYDGNTTSTSTYNVLDGISSFFNNLFSQSQPLSMTEFLQRIVETDVNYTLIKTSLTEDFSPEISYNLIVSSEGSTGTNDYKVAMSRIASLVADVFSNTAMAENKVVEVSTDPSAPLRSIEELFSAIPEDGRRQAYAEALARERAEEQAKIAAEKACEAAEAARKLEEEVKKLSEQEARAANLAEEAQEKAKAAGTSVENILNKAKGISSGLSWDKLSSQISTAVQKSVEKPKVQIATIRGQAKARSLIPQRAAVKQSTSSPTTRKEEPKPKLTEEPKAEVRKASNPFTSKLTEERKAEVRKVSSPSTSKPKEEPKAEVRKLFGGLFTQETVYVDDD